MIATLTGKITESDVGYVVLEVAGVGYGVRVSARSQDGLTAGESTKLYIHEHIKEDAHDLFGFLAADDRALFEQLLSVKNVGPKVAMAVLDLGSVQDVRSVIAAGDVKRLQTAKGVGKRAAEQIVVELRDKVGLLSSGAAEDIVTRGGLNTADDAVMALVGLGYSETDAILALKGIDKDLSTEDRIKQALKGK